MYMFLNANTLYLNPATQQNDKKSYSNNKQYEASQFKEMFNSIKSSEKQNNGVSSNFTKSQAKEKKYQLFTKKRVTAVANNTSEKEVKKDISESIESEDFKKKAVKMSDFLSQLLGIESPRFAELLNATGLNDQDITEIDKVNQFIVDLAAIAGFNEEHAIFLSDIIEIGLKGSEALTSSINNNVEQHLKQDTDLINETNSGAESSEELSFDINDNYEEISKELYLRFQDLLSKNSNKHKDFLGNSKKDLNDIVPVNNAASEVIETAGEKANSEETKLLNENKDKTASKHFRTANLEKMESGFYGNSPLEEKNHISENIKNDAPIDNIVSVNIDTSDFAARKSFNEISAVLKDTKAAEAKIFSQIIDKAKINFHDGKAEMMMHLKPDSLGKVSLKLITEHGIVMAKFITENHQVKEIIESNMQLLKDVLVNQGISVGGFSVSVRQDSSGQSEWKNDSSKSKKTAIDSSNSIITEHGIADHTISNMQKINAYNFSESKINLTA